MVHRKEGKKLRFRAEVLQSVLTPRDPLRGDSLTSPGCTVLTTCSPGCCDETKVEG